MKTKRLARVLMFSVVLAIVLVASGYAAKKGYVAFRRTRLLDQARDHLANSQPKKALLCLRRALAANPRDVEAVRLMADLSEQDRSPSALFWRGRVIELLPSSDDDRFALARTAFTFRDLTIASNALQGVTGSRTNSAAYNNLAGGLAIASGQLGTAEAHFLEASRLEPTNLILRLNVAVVRLQQADSAVAAEEARTALRQLTNSPIVSSRALRELVGDSIRNRQTNEALALVHQLVQKTNSTFSDRLLHLDLLENSRDSRFRFSLTNLQHEAADKPAALFDLAMWMLPRTGPRDTLAWLERLPSETKTNQPAVLFAAHCRSALQDWRGLQTSLEKQDWKEVDFMRRAFIARALRQQDLTAAAKSEWEIAVKGAHGRKQSLLMLVGMVIGWNWRAEQEQLLWILVNRFPSEKWAATGLTELLYAQGRTQALLGLFTQLAKSNPSDLAVKNNLAATALLLNAPQVKPFELAREVYEKAPTNAAYVSTYAYSLYVQEKRAQALEILETLTPQDLERPSVAAYYGVMLHAIGQADRARKYFDIASKASLLPEEQKLIESARKM